MVFSGVISFERPYEKDGAPSCGIYLVVEDVSQPKMLIEQLRPTFTALNSSKYRRNMHALEMHFPAEIYDKEREAAISFVALCKRNGVVPLIRNNLGLLVECGAEGVIVPDLDDMAQAREVIGESGILGVQCGADQQKAQAAVEAGADYTVIDASLLPWWSTTTHLPAAISGDFDDAAAIIELVKNGAGFLRAGDWVWHHKDGPARAIYWLQEMIEHGLAQRVMN